MKILKECLRKYLNQYSKRNEVLYMDILSSLVLTFLISLVICVITYILQYQSAISPCNIEFDCRHRYEMYIMNRYNLITNKIFNVAMIVIILSMISMLMFENTYYMLFVVILEFVYFIANTLFMIIVFLRSKIYWYRAENKEIIMNK